MSGGLQHAASGLAIGQNVCLLENTGWSWQMPPSDIYTYTQHTLTQTNTQTHTLACFPEEAAISSPLLTTSPSFFFFQNFSEVF